MSAPEAAAFDAAVADVVRPYEQGGVLTTDIVAHIAWGTPAR
jgi:hypothetical protein